MPAQSSWLGIWKFIVHFCLFWGYFIYPYHIAFYLSELDNPNYPDNHYEETDKINEFIIDIFLTIDILINFLTAYQSNDINWIDDICLIAQNYAKGNLIFDLMATMPGIITGQSSRFYWFKLIRFIHLRVVYNMISLLVKGVLTRMNLTKSSVEKTSYSFNLIIYMFSAIHILGCTWIYIGKTVECSWIKGGCDKGGTVVEILD